MFIPGVDGSEAEYTLLQMLFVRYDPNNRPVANVTGTVTVTMDLAINQIIDLVCSQFYIRLDLL